MLAKAVCCYETGLLLLIKAVLRLLLKCCVIELLLYKLLVKKLTHTVKVT